MARPPGTYDLWRTARKDPDGTRHTVADVIVERTRMGMDHARAAGSAGVTRATEHKYRAEAGRARARLANATSTDPRADGRLARFLDALEAAEDQAEHDRLGIVVAAAAGTLPPATTTTERWGILRDGQGDPVLDADGKVQHVVVDRTVKVEQALPSWQAAGWWLARRRGYVERHEVTGAEGAPLLPAGDRAGQLADSLRTFLEGAAAQAELSAEAQADG